MLQQLLESRVGTTGVPGQKPLEDGVEQGPGSPDLELHATGQDRPARGTRFCQVRGAAREPPLGDFEGHVSAGLELDEAIARRKAASGENADELVLGTYSERAIGEATDLVEIGLPLRRIGLIGNEREDLLDGPLDLHGCLDVDHAVLTRRITGSAAGEPGFEPGFTVLETVRMDR